MSDNYYNNKYKRIGERRSANDAFFKGIFINHNDIIKTAFRLVDSYTIFVRV